MPRYRDAVYGGESTALENRFLRLEFHRRFSGWAWGELMVAGERGERFFAVLEHLAEAKIAQLHHPFRLEADSFSLEENAGEQRIVFPVRLQQRVHPKHGILDAPPLTGTVTFALPRDEPAVVYRLRLEVHYLVHLQYLRGPWLRLGADSFGTERDDAIFPGVEWLQGREWSSSTDWFEHPWALRVAPHPHKVAIPVMALSHGGVGLGLSWEPAQTSMSTRLRMRCPQPVFASPNFVDRRNEHLMGLMLPSARWGLEENALAADPPLSMSKGTPLALDARISVARGGSLDVVLDWVRRHGLPDPGEPRYPWPEAIERIARAYDTNLWVEGEGFRGAGQHYGSEDRGQAATPESVREYIRCGSDPTLRERLARKAAWCESRRPAQEKRPPVSTPLRHLLLHPEDARQVAEALLARQTPEGDFPFDPDGLHRTNHIDDANCWRPMGRAGDSALGLCAEAAAALLAAGEPTGERRFLEAGRKALDFALRLGDRPEGGDWWETPLHSPNLLAAGHGAIAYALGHRVFGEARYLDRARHWVRCLIPFTHLWQPPDVPILYNTKPCLNSSVWHLSSWVNKQVQWEVLETFAWSERLRIRWARLDPEFDWDLFHRGVTAAVLRWMIDHEDPDWMYCSEFPVERVRTGDWDTLWADTFDPVHNTYGGGPIPPDIIAESVRIVLKRLGAE